MSALQGIYTSQLADPADLGMLLGAQQAAYGVGGAAGPAFGAALLALTGSYRPVMAAAAVDFLASALPLRPFDLARRAAPVTTSRGDEPESHARDNQSGPCVQPGDKVR
jgi:MFS family permease